MTQKSAKLLGRVSLGEVFPLVTTERQIFKEFLGFKVKMDSLRYQVFARPNGHKCVKCGLEGTFFQLEQQKDHAPDRAHLNLYAGLPDGRLILMTKDHILPRSEGGKDRLENLQTCCLPCNLEKGSRID